MINYRVYQAGDEKALVTVWNQNMPKDPMTEKRLRNLVLLDANFDPKGMQLAFDDDKLIGCVYAVRRLLPMFGTDLEKNTGWIPFLFVAKQYRRKGIGSRLMKQALEFLKSQERTKVFFSSYAPNYILPGIDQETYPHGYSFLIRQGFKEMYAPIAMDKRLVEFELSSDVVTLKRKREAEGYLFQQAKNSDLYELIQFATHTFNPDWGRAIREGILQGLPMERILVAKHKDKIMGFAMHGGYEGIAERFGPFGVDPAYQGKGFGKLILNECLYQMKAEGLHGAWFLWTGEESSAGYLYKKTGFEITRTFHVMKKEI